jgi:hypothetical protein
MEPTIGMRALSSPPSVAKSDWATGRTPRTSSVNVSASAMASSKLSTGNWYLQGWMVVALAFARKPFAARTWTSSCYY